MFQAHMLSLQGFKFEYHKTSNSFLLGVKGHLYKTVGWQKLMTTEVVLTLLIF